MYEHFWTFVAVAALSSVLCGLFGRYLFFDFQSRPTSNDPASISSFFQMNEIVQRKNLRAYSLIYAFGLSGITFLTIVYVAASDSLKQNLIAIISTQIAKESDSFTSQILKIVVDNLDPEISVFIVILSAAFVFWPHILSALKLVKVVAHKGIGFDKSCDLILDQTAKDVFEQDKENLYTFNVSLPRELGANPGKHDIVKYSIMDKISDFVPDNGLIGSIYKVLTKDQVKISLPLPVEPISITTAFVLFMSYCVLVLLYITFFPMIGNGLCHDACAIGRLQFEVPGAVPAKYWLAALHDLAIDSTVFSLEVSIPLWIGLMLFERKRMTSAGKISDGDNFISTSSLQVVLSVIFFILGVLVVYVHDRNSNHDEFNPLSLDQALQIFFAASVPPFTTFVWMMLGSKRILHVSGIVIAPVMGSILYLIEGVCYDVLSPLLNGAAGAQMSPHHYLFVYWGLKCMYMLVICFALKAAQDGLHRFQAPDRVAGG